MQVAKRVAINTGFLYGRMAITVFISLYSTRLILAALGAADFGIFNLVGGIILMLGFVNASMAAATQRFMSFAQGKGDFDNVRKIFSVSIILHIVIAVVLFFLLQLAGQVLFNYVLNIDPSRREAAWYIFQFMVASTLFTVVSVPFDAIINSHENMFLFAILGIVEAVLKLAIALLITQQSGDKLIFYGLCMAIVTIVLFLAKAFYCFGSYKECTTKVRADYDSKLMKEMTSFAGWSFLGLSTGMIASYGQGMVLNVFFGTVVNAAQGIASQVSGQLSAFSTTMLKALNPVIDKSEGAGDRNMMLYSSMMGSKVSFFLLMIMFVPVIVEMPFIFQIWLKNVPHFAVIFCELLLIRNLIEQLFVTLVTSIAAVGNIRKFQIYSSVITFFPLLVSYILFYFGFPAYSLYIVFIVYSLIASANIMYFAKKTCGLSIRLYASNVIVKCVLSFLALLLLASLPLLFLQEGYLRLFAVGGASMLAFLPVVYFVGLGEEERDMVRKLKAGAIAKFSPQLKKMFLTLRIAKA